MSTILKALAKLEREKEALRAAGPLPVVSVPGAGRGGPAGWLMKPWLWLTLVVLIVAVLGGTAWHFYRQSRSYAPLLAERSDAKAPPQAERRAPQEPIPAAAPPAAAPARPEHREFDRLSRPERPAAPVQPESRQAPPEAVMEEERIPPPAETHVRGTPERPPARENPAVRHTPPRPVPAGPAPSSRAIERPTLDTPPAREAPAENQAPARVAAPAKPKVLPAAPSNRETPADAYADTPLLTDGRLRVHAIAWAPQPADRMAVINSHILHEGDAVEDFAVLAIRPDDVVVREKGKGVWRVEFGRP